MLHFRVLLYSHILAGNVNTALTLQKKPSLKILLGLTKFLMPTFRETVSVPNSYIFNKNAFNIAEEPDSFHPFFLKSAVIHKLVSLILLFTAILDKNIMVRTRGFLLTSYQRLCVSYNPSDKESTRKRHQLLLPHGLYSEA